MMIDKAFILAAGFGTRMRPLTDTIPKPMVTIGGQSLIEHILDKLEAVGVRKVIVNTHYLPHIIEEHLKPRTHPKITVSYEEEILDTGGGIQNALALFDDKPFYVIAGDAFWMDTPQTQALALLAEQWDEEKMDILTLMHPLNAMHLTKGVGDYHLKPDGTVMRALERNGTHMWTNIRINHPRLFADAPDGAFSFLDLMDRAEKQGRFFALEYDGWHHISTPEDLEAVRKYYDEQNAA